MSVPNLVEPNQQCGFPFWARWDTPTYQDCSVSVTDHKASRMNPVIPSFAASDRSGADEVDRWWKVLVDVGVQALSSTWCYMLTPKDGTRRACRLGCHRLLGLGRDVEVRRVNLEA